MLLLRLMEILLSLVSFTFHSWSRIKLRSFFFFPFNNRDFLPFLSLLFFFFAKFGIYLFFYSYVLKYFVSKFLISLFQILGNESAFKAFYDLIRFYRINIYRTFSLDSLFPVFKKNREYFILPSLNLHQLAQCTYQ